MDRAFLKLLEKKIGKQNFKTLTKGTLESSIGSHMAWSKELSEIMKDWEQEKRDFAGEEDRQKYIRLPRNLEHLEIPERGVTEGSVQITA